MQGDCFTAAPEAAGKEKPQHRHTLGETKIVNEVPATTTSGGQFTLITYCGDPNCRQQIDIVTYHTDPVSAPPECVHDWEGTGSAVNDLEYYINYKCKKCGATKVEGPFPFEQGQGQ